MVGMNIAKEHLNSIVKRTMKEADTNRDGFITLDEFKKVMRKDMDMTDNNYCTY